jgi:hypothetical protein
MIYAFPDLKVGAIVRENFGGKDAAEFILFISCKCEA